jgi:hypothetical protein
MNDITRRKTGLFKPVWTQDFLSGYLVYVEMGKKGGFGSGQKGDDGKLARDA